MHEADDMHGKSCCHKPEKQLTVTVVALCHTCRHYVIHGRAFLPALILKSLPSLATEICSQYTILVVTFVQPEMALYVLHVNYISSFSVIKET